jgi:hypothetical protein
MDIINGGGRIRLRVQRYLDVHSNRRHWRWRSSRYNYLCFCGRLIIALIKADGYFLTQRCLIALFYASHDLTNFSVGVSFSISLSNWDRHQSAVLRFSSKWLIIERVRLIFFFLGFSCHFLVLWLFIWISQSKRNHHALLQPRAGHWFFRNCHG